MCLTSPAALPLGKRRRYQFNRELGGPQNQSGHFGKEINILSLPRFEPRIAYPVTTLSRIFRLPFDVIESIRRWQLLWITHKNKLSGKMLIINLLQRFKSPSASGERACAENDSWHKVSFHDSTNSYEKSNVILKWRSYGFLYRVR
jgi:hypothetical protein